MTIDEATDLLSQLLGIRLGYGKVYNWWRYGSQKLKLEFVSP